jgi:hypothetical protein
MQAPMQEAWSQPSNREWRRRVWFRTRRLRTSPPALRHYDLTMSQQDPTPEREWDWEHWPGRRDPEDGIRHRLRGLFSHTGSPAESAVEELLAERGRELEMRTEQLAATVADLQRREERARELRTAVEEMLRHGSAELDERHAKLNELAAELGRREASLAAAEHGLTERRGELGAVELRRAALERREAAIAERETALERVSASLQERERALDERRREQEQGLSRPSPPAAPAEEPVETAHLVFAAGDRYRLLERDGPAPAPGTTVELDGHRMVVQRLGVSPLPGDARRCAYAEPLGDAHNAA